MSWCLCKRRQFSSNGAASIQNSHGRGNFIAMASSRLVWVLHTVIFTHFLTRNHAKILILKGLNRWRSAPWDWGIILICFLFRVWFCWLDGIIITPSCVLKMFNRRIAECQHWYNGRHMMYYMPIYVSWLWRGGSLVKIHILAMKFSTHWS